MDVFQKVTEFQKSENKLQAGFDLLENSADFRKLWESDPQQLFKNFLSDAVDSVIGTSSSALAQKFLGMSAEAAINPWSVLLTAGITAVEKGLMHSGENVQTRPWRQGDFCLIEKGVNQELMRSEAWAEAAMFESGGGDDGLMLQAEKKFEIGMIESVLDGKGCQVYNLITREREFVDLHKLRLPSEAIQTNKPLQNLVNNFIFGKKLPKEVEHNGLRIHDTVHYKHSNELFEIVRFVD